MDITEIEIDDGNEEHLTRHGVSIAEVQQVLAGASDIRRNRKDCAGTHVALGPTDCAAGSWFPSSTRATDAFVRSAHGR